MFHQEYEAPNCLDDSIHRAYPDWIVLLRQATSYMNAFGYHRAVGEYWVGISFSESEHNIRVYDIRYPELVIFCKMLVIFESHTFIINKLLVTMKENLEYSLLVLQI